MFGVKDPVLRELHKCVAHKFLCAGCNTCYVGETSRHLSTRVRKHLISDTACHIFSHLHNSPQFRTLNILNQASTTFQLKIKEAIHIQWEKPPLNHQLYHVNLKLSL